MKIVGSEFVRSKRQKCFNEYDVVYLKRQGYIEGTRTGNFVYMVKPVKAYVTIETSRGIRIRQDMRQQILDYYGLTQLKVERFNKFLSDVYSGKITLDINSNGDIIIC